MHTRLRPMFTTAFMGAEANSSSERTSASTPPRITPKPPSTSPHSPPMMPNSAPNMPPKTPIHTGNVSCLLYTSRCV